jgi:hypothetical protein
MLVFLAASQGRQLPAGQVEPARGASVGGGGRSAKPTTPLAEVTSRPSALGDAHAGLAATGSDIVVHVGQRLVVDLAERWTAPAARAREATPTAPLQPLRRDHAQGFPVPGPASATFTAVRVGWAVVTLRRTTPARTRRRFAPCRSSCSLSPCTCCRARERAPVLFRYPCRPSPPVRQAMGGPAAWPDRPSRKSRALLLEIASWFRECRLRLGRRPGRWRPSRSVPTRCTPKVACPVLRCPGIGTHRLPGCPTRSGRRWSR